MALDILVFLGSVRESTPPKPARLGLRVARACQTQLMQNHNVTLIDPLEIEFTKAFKPHFSYAKGAAPTDMESLAAKIEQADAYVMVSPEYNHSMSPALADLLNHFGSSLFSYKPSAIVTYSAGQWGGARAAVNMRTYLSELGCLPVSAMIHIPKAQDILNVQGHFQEDQDAIEWAGYFDRTFTQLQWWGMAAKNQRQSGKIEPPAAFRKDPSQRNAP
ncbi:MAG: NADPH-dependent FMN reductase [Pseudomonadota bacterium]